jgi:2-phosphosulfolactate phosphatase
MEDDHRPKVEVCFSPNLYPLHKAGAEIVVVIDVLRATSAMCAALHYGVLGIIPVLTLEEARLYQSQGYIVGAERDGKVVDGFAFGNSPFAFMNEKFKGKTLVLSTTNGTKTIQVASHAKTVVIGSLLNLDALVKWLHSQKKNVLCLCAGWKDKFNLEDTICAGGIAHGLLETGDFTSDEDASVAAKYIYLSARENYMGYLKSSSHRRRLQHLNIKEDIIYCLTPNQTEVIPILHNGVLVRHDSI